MRWKRTYEKKLRELLLMAGLMAAFVIAGAVTVRAETKEITALEGIYIEDISVGGMTEAEIHQAVDGKMEILKTSAIHLGVGEEAAQVSAEELGLSWVNQDLIQQALSVGQKGNVLERFKVNKRLEQGEPITLSLTFSVDPDAVRQAVETYAVPLNRDAVDASLSRENGTFVVYEGQDGYTVNMDASVEKVINYMTNTWRGGLGSVTMETEISPAGGDPSQLSLVQDVLGQSSTDYSGSNRNRKQNVSTGTSRINGTVLYPGESFSVTDAVTPFDEENGYAPAASYEMGSVVESYGGGICQVSTTLYLAVLRAELEVTQRYNHSMIVNYVKPSMDAAIAEGVKDFCFVNNTDAPIYILGYADGSDVGFVIYGHETRDPNRSISYESKTLTTTECTTSLSADSSAAYGSVTRVSSGHVGYTAELWKVIEINGNETREQVNSSTYNMTPNKYTVGTKTDDPDAKAAMQAAIAANDLGKVEEAAAKYPGGKSQSAAPQSSGEEGSVEENSSDNEE
ncbi:MAG: VanW family protein [Fusicatenibacter sp.]